MDTTNDFLVSVLNDKIVLIAPPREPITTEQALRLAAYLVALSGGQTEFAKVLAAVENA